MYLLHLVCALVTFYWVNLVFNRIKTVLQFTNTVDRRWLLSLQAASYITLTDSKQEAKYYNPRLAMKKEIYIKLFTMGTHPFIMLSLVISLRHFFIYFTSKIIKNCVTSYPRVSVSKYRVMLLCINRKWNRNNTCFRAKEKK